MEKQYKLDFVKGSSLHLSNDSSQTEYDEERVGHKAKDTRLFYEALVGLKPVDEGPKHGSGVPQELDNSWIEKEPVEVHSTNVSVLRQNEIVIKSDIRINCTVSKDLFTCASNGRTSKLDELVKRYGNSVMDIKDQYDWTLLMVAASCGQEGTVTYLLEKGIDSEAVDISGNDAYSIALKGKHYNTADIIKDFKSGQYCREQNSSTDCYTDCIPLSSEKDYKIKEKDEYNVEDTKFCSLCNVRYKDSKKQRHGSSTVHLFNQNINRPIPNHDMPVDNIGYKLMQKSGWQEGQGLGPSGQGTTTLVPTTLKRDRLGLGLEKRPPKRVTHFKPFDEDSIKGNSRKNETKNIGSKGLRKAKALKQKSKSRQWEINIRSYMNGL